MLVSVARISQRSFLRTVTFGSAALTVKGSGLAQSLTRSAKPNLLVFLPDELRADLIVGESAGSLHAPHLHQLASESVIFERAYITHPICSPSRSSLLTGTWPHQTGCMDNAGVLPTKFRCLPEMVGDSAYRTGYFGKWHLGDEFFPQHGFQKWASIEDSFKSADSGRKKRARAITQSSFFPRVTSPICTMGKVLTSSFRPPSRSSFPNQSSSVRNDG